MVTKHTKQNNLKKKQEKAKTDEEATEKEHEEAPGPLATHVNKILHSVFSNVEVYIYNQQFYDSNGLYAYKSYISNNFKEAISEHKYFALRGVRFWRVFWRTFGMAFVWTFFQMVNEKA